MVVLFKNKVYICVKHLHMNFTEFYKDLSEEFGIPHDTSKRMVSFLQKKMRKKLLFGTEVTLRNIGTFVLKVSHPKPFLNLQTAKMQISERCFKLNFRVTRRMDEDLKKKTVFGYDSSQPKQ